MASWPAADPGRRRDGAAGDAGAGDGEARGVRILNDGARLGAGDGSAEASGVVLALLLLRRRPTNLRNLLLPDEGPRCWPATVLILGGC